jgi:TRAP-type mannitol/chloroaromatic compound transport system substrate-binding protein
MLGATKRNSARWPTTIALALSLIMPAVASADKTYRMRVQAAVPSGAMSFEMLETFADRVDKMSDGRLKVRVLGAGAILPSPQILDAVSKGTIEAGFAWPQYWAGKHPAAAMFSNTPVWAMAGLDQMSHFSWMQAGEGEQLYQELMQKHIGANVRSFHVTASGWQPLGWFNEPINNLADLKKGRYRSPPGLIGEILAEAGVNTIFLPPEELVPAAERGVVWAAGWINPVEDYPMGFHDIFKYYYLASIHQHVDVGELLINAKFYDSLPADIQEIIRVASRSTILETYVQDISRNADMIQTYKNKHGIDIRSTPADINSALLTAGQKVVERHAQKDEFFAKVLASQVAFAKKLRPSWGATLKSYHHLSEDAVIE